MIYLALGDSISIDDYTGVPGGGAASQFARLIGAAEFDNRTKDGCTTFGVLESLQHTFRPPDIVTLTVSGNDLLMALGMQGVADVAPAEIAKRYDEIVSQLRELSCPVILNTIYDPTDGRDDRAIEIGLTGQVRQSFGAVNNHIRSKAGDNLILCDLEDLFKGHGYWSREPWITGYIEPNHAGATVIADRWRRLYRTWMQAD